MYKLERFEDSTLSRLLISTFALLSCRPSLPLKFLASELAFADVQEAHEFLKINSLAVYIEPTPSEAVNLAASMASTNASRKKGRTANGSASKPSVPLEQRKWDCKSALRGVISAGEKYRKIDIKGQI